MRRECCNGESECAASPIDIAGIHCAELYRLEQES